MSTRYFIREDGTYAGGFANHVNIETGEIITEVIIPDGLIEIEAPPIHGLDKWDFKKKKWIPFIPVENE